MPAFCVLDSRRRRVLYRAATLEGAKGYVSGTDRPCCVVAEIESTRIETRYEITLVDDETGQTVAVGPIIDILDAPELLFNLRVVLRPATGTEGTVRI